MSAEEIITKLTSINLDLEEQNRKYQIEISELEQLHQLDEELIQMHKETEMELQHKNQELAIVVAKLNHQITDLEAKLDAQMSAEEIIANLTNTNMDLEEQNKKYQIEISELEQLHYMDEQIMETQKEIEKDLQLKNEEQMIVIAALRRQLTEWENRVVDYERAILKFRQKITDLNEQVQNLHDELDTMRAREEEKARAAGAEITLLANANREFSEKVEDKLNMIELESSKQHILYLRSFLPDNFTKPGGDNDCLILCVLFPRISIKSLTLFQLLQQKYPLPPGGLRREHVTLTHRAEQWAHVRHFGYQLYQLHTIAQKFIAVFKHCSPERLSRLAVQQLEIIQRETHLDEYFTLLKQNRFDENTSIDRLERIIQFFQRLFSANLSTEQFNAREDLRNTLGQIKEGLSWLQINSERLRHFVQINDINANNATVAGGPDITAFVDQIGQLLTECQKLVMRALNRIPKDNELILTSELSERLLSAIAALEKCGRIVQQCCLMATSQLGAIDSEGLSAQEMLDFVLSSVEKFVGQVDGHSKAHAHIYEFLESIKTVMDGLSEALENSSMEIPPSTKANTSNGFFPPLLDRAYARKEDAVQAEGLRWQVAKKDEELVKLQRALKAREQDIGTLKLRLDMAEKQLTENTVGAALNAEIELLQAKCDQLQADIQRQWDDHQLEVGELAAKLAESEAERKKEQERTREFSKKALFANLRTQQQQQPQIPQLQTPTGSSPSTPLADSVSSGLGTLGGGGADGGGRDSALGQQPMDAQQMAGELRVAREKIRILERQQLLSAASSLNGASVANNFSATGSRTAGTQQHHQQQCSACAERNQNEHTELGQMMAEAEALVREQDQLLRPTDPREWSKYQRAVESINFRAESLRIRFHRFWRKYRRSEPMPTLLLPIPRPTTTAATHGITTEETAAAIPPSREERALARERLLRMFA